MAQFVSRWIGNNATQVSKEEITMHTEASPKFKKWSGIITICTL